MFINLEREPTCISVPEDVEPLWGFLKFFKCLSFRETEHEQGRGGEDTNLK